MTYFWGQVACLHTISSQPKINKIYLYNNLTQAQLKESRFIDLMIVMIVRRMSICSVSEEGCQFVRYLWKDVILLNLCEKMSFCQISVQGCHLAQSMQKDVILLSLCERMSIYSISEGGRKLLNLCGRMSICSISGWRCHFHSLC